MENKIFKYIWLFNGAFLALSVAVLGFGLSGLDPFDLSAAEDRKHQRHRSEDGTQETTGEVSQSDLVRLAGEFGDVLEPPPKPVEKPKPRPKPAEKPPEKVGRLVAEKSTVDLGRVDPGEVKEATFTISNGGEKPLELDNVTGGTAVQIGELEEKTLAPGEKTSFKVTYTAPVPAGRQRETIMVMAKGDSHPKQLMLALTAEVKTYVVAQPGSLTFDAGKKSGETVSVALKCQEGLPFRVIGYLIDGEVATIPLETDTKATVHELSMQTDAGKVKDNSKGGNLTFKVDHPKVREVSLRYAVKIPPPPKPVAKPTFKLSATMMIGPQGVMAWVKPAKGSKILPFVLGEKIDEHYILTDIADGYVTVYRGGQEFKVEVPEPGPIKAAATPKAVAQPAKPQPRTQPRARPRTVTPRQPRSR